MAMGTKQRRTEKDAAYLLQVGVELLQHHLQVVEAARQIVGDLVARNKKCRALLNGIKQKALGSFRASLRQLVLVKHEAESVPHY